MPGARPWHDASHERRFRRGVAPLRPAHVLGVAAPLVADLGLHVAPQTLAWHIRCLAIPRHLLLFVGAQHALPGARPRHDASHECWFRRGVASLRPAHMLGVAAPLVADLGLHVAPQTLAWHIRCLAMPRHLLLFLGARHAVPGARPWHDASHERRFRRGVALLSPARDLGKTPAIRERLCRGRLFSNEVHTTRYLHSLDILLA